eukprot:TRINITY_DN19116_c0_g1_i1.p1 TRINITY_DN19116_c0_g1~~TRINITY_DN19116_c0_g1_i1.p1  ORF type:complete len:570 (-),score=104.39 TRINITY_DN19116_c0_g1_i1:1044-2720(-)
MEEDDSSERREESALPTSASPCGAEAEEYGTQERRDESDGPSVEAPSTEEQVDTDSSRRHAAALSIQHLWRNTVWKQEQRVQLRETIQIRKSNRAMTWQSEAVLSVQLAWRSFVARRKVAALAQTRKAKKLDQETVLRNGAAVDVQRCWRGSRDRKRTKARRSEVQAQRQLRTDFAVAESVVRDQLTSNEQLDRVALYKACSNGAHCITQLDHCQDEYTVSRSALLHEAQDDWEGLVTAFETSLQHPGPATIEASSVEEISLLALEHADIKEATPSLLHPEAAALRIQHTWMKSEKRKQKQVNPENSIHEEHASREESDAIEEKEELGVAAEILDEPLEAWHAGRMVRLALYAFSRTWKDEELEWDGLIKKERSWRKSTAEISIAESAKRSAALPTTAAYNSLSPIYRRLPRHDQATPLPPSPLNAPVASQIWQLPQAGLSPRSVIQLPPAAAPLVRRLSRCARHLADLPLRPLESSDDGVLETITTPVKRPGSSRSGRGDLSAASSRPGTATLSVLPALAKINVAVTAKLALSETELTNIQRFSYQNRGATRLPFDI